VWRLRKDAGVPEQNAVVQTRAHVLKNLHFETQILADEHKNRLLTKSIYFFTVVLINYNFFFLV